jgi:hypothetical protein
MTRSSGCSRTWSRRLETGNRQGGLESAVPVEEYGEELGLLEDMVWETGSGNSPAGRVVDLEPTMMVERVVIL